MSALRFSQYKATQSTNKYSKAGLQVTTGAQIPFKCDAYILCMDHKKHHVISHKNECAMIFFFFLGGRSTCEGGMSGHVPSFTKIAVNKELIALCLLQLV